MLTDSRRNVAYNAALRRVLPAKQLQNAAAQPQTPSNIPTLSTAAAAAVNEPNTAPAPSANTAAAASSSSSISSAVPPVRVLDIGTGTGLLAMMAARALGIEAAATAAAATTALDAAAAAAGATAATSAPSADAPPSAPVVACEVFPPMQNLARRVVAANGLNNVVRIVNKRSDEMVVRMPSSIAATTEGSSAAAANTAHAAAMARARARLAAAAAGEGSSEPDMTGRADVIVTEIFDSELLGEGMIPTMRHAVQHLLKEGGVVIPATSRVYGQIVQCPLMHHMTGLRTADATSSSSAAASSSNGSPTENAWSNGDAADASSSGRAEAAASRVLGVLGELDARARATTYKGDELYEVREMHVDLLYRDPQQQQQGEPLSSSSSPPLAAQQQQLSPDGAAPPLLPLSEPFLVFDFDWLRPPPSSGRRTTLQVPVVQQGTAHAVLLWWQLGMTPEDLRLQPTGPAAAAAAPGREVRQEPQQEQQPSPSPAQDGASLGHLHPQQQEQQRQQQ
ncbi:hypothetical protein Agub_g3989, partial [Astrephomene gubernaculifera]